MKKTFFATMALIVVFAFTACDKPEKTKEEMLTQKNGWILSTATSVPGYQMADGDRYSDLIKGEYFYEWELDDIYFYDTNGALRVDPGKKLPPEGEDGFTKVTTLGTWVLSNNNTRLLTKVPSFYDKDDNGAWTMDEVTILELTEDILKYEFTFRVEEKKKGIKSDEIYTFTLTYIKK
jgi:hypothetical protein